MTFKVICMDDRNHHDATMPFPLNYGAVYTVTGRVIVNGQVGYALAEVDPTSGFSHFHSQRFLPLTENCKRINFIIGADPESDCWDNRKKQREPI